MTDKPGRSRWFRYSLRASLVFVTCVAIALAWFTNHTRGRTIALAAIRKAGGKVEFYWAPPGWNQRLESWFGKDLFGKVRSVDLREGKADNDLMKHIAVLEELKELDLSYAPIDNEGVRQIAHLPLRQLWLQSTKITDASAETLAPMKTLEFLALNATSISDPFLEKLPALPELTHLGLRGSKVTGAGMKYLPQHPKLKSLDVYSTSVDDAGVQSLAECQGLTDLGLSMTKISDDALLSIAKLPKLEHVDLSANQTLTEEAVKAFKAGHPTCDVEKH